MERGCWMQAGRKFKVPACLAVWGWHFQFATFRFDSQLYWPNENAWVFSLVLWSFERHLLLEVRPHVCWNLLLRPCAHPNYSATFACILKRLHVILRDFHIQTACLADPILRDILGAVSICVKDSKSFFFFFFSVLPFDPTGVSMTSKTSRGSRHSRVESERDYQRCHDVMMSGKHV